jgi:hypothetical protein
MTEEKRDREEAWRRKNKWNGYHAITSGQEQATERDGNLLG